MSNILVFLDMSSKRVHLYHEIGFHIKDRSTQKVEIWNKSPKLYYIDIQVNKEYCFSPLQKIKPFHESGKSFFGCKGNLLPVLSTKIWS